MFVGVFSQLMLVGGFEDDRGPAVGRAGTGGRPARGRYAAVARRRRPDIPINPVVQFRVDVGIMIPVARGRPTPIFFERRVLREDILVPRTIRAGESALILFRSSQKCQLLSAPLLDLLGRRISHDRSDDVLHLLIRSCSGPSAERGRAERLVQEDPLRDVSARADERGRLAHTGGGLAVAALAGNGGRGEDGDVVIVQVKNPPPSRGQHSSPHWTLPVNQNTQPFLKVP